MKDTKGIHGIISGAASEGKGSYFRKIALVGALVSPLFAIVGYFFVPGTIELWFDRVLITFIGLTLFFLPREAFVNKRSFLTVHYTYYYVYCIHAIFAAWINSFGTFQVLFILVALQCCVLSFQKAGNATAFIAAMVVFATCSLFTLDSLDASDKVMYTVVFATFGVLNAFLARIKCKVIADIRFSRDLLRSLVRKTENAIFITDTSGIIFDCNPRASEMFGYAREEFLNRDFLMLRAEALTKAEIEEGFSSLMENRFWVQEKFLMMKDGGRIQTCITISLLDRDGEHFLAYRVRDISASKQHELELTKAKEAAEDAAQAKAQFLATMTHEIRTPLNGVIGMASVLQSSTLNFEQRDYVDTILKSGQSLMVLINDILDFSKMESGHARLEELPTNLFSAVSEVCDLLRPHADTKRIRLAMDISPDIPSTLLSDEGRLKQVLLNLVGNAIKFTHYGGVTVKGEMKWRTKEFTEVVLHIQDTGIGIPKDKLHLLFQSFSQVDASTSRKYGGTGLGLAISKQIVELLDGRIEVESKEQKGTTFSVHLRLKNQQEHTSTAVLQDTWQPDEECSQLRILVAEDNGVNQKVIEYMLRQAGVQAHIVSNGIEALHYLQENTVDIVFMDIQMPEMNGLDATKAIRAAHGNKHFIVAMTANNSEQDKVEAFEAGMDHFVSKPFVMQQMFACLAHYLKNVRGRNVLAA